MKNNKVISNELLLGLLAISIVLVFVVFWILSSVQSEENWSELQRHKLTVEDKTNINTKVTAQKMASTGKINIPILTYHHIDQVTQTASESLKSLTVTPENFELQVAWLKGQGYESISLNDILLYSKGLSLPPEKPIVLTFNEGHEDVFENAIPILKKYGFTASFGVITQFPGFKYEENSYAPWPTIKKAKMQGMEIVSQTQDHFDATSSKYDETFILRNLKESQEDLKKNLGEALPIIIYPFGRYDERFLKLVKEAGFELGVTTNTDTLIDFKKLLEIPRIKIGGSYNLEAFKNAIQ